MTKPKPAPAAKPRIAMATETVAGTAPPVGGSNWQRFSGTPALAGTPYLILARGKNGVFSVFACEGDENLHDLLLEDIEAVATTPDALAAQVATWAATPRTSHAA